LKLAGTLQSSLTLQERDWKRFLKLTWEENKPNLPGSFSSGKPELPPSHSAASTEANLNDRRTPGLPHIRGFVSKALKDLKLRNFSKTLPSFFGHDRR